MEDVSLRSRLTVKAHTIRNTSIFRYPVHIHVWPQAL